MSHIDAMKQALEYLQDNQHLIADNERHAYVMEYNAFIERFEQAITLAEQSAPAQPNHALVDELKKFYAMPPYNTSSNFVQWDGRYYKDIQARYTAEQINAACVELGITKGGGV